MDNELLEYLKGMEARINSNTAQAIQGVEDRTAALIGAEVGSLHTQIKQVEERLTAEIQIVAARQRGDAGVITSMMELVMKLTRSHEQSDNAVAAIAAKQTELSRRLDERKQ